MPDTVATPGEQPKKKCPAAVYLGRRGGSTPTNKPKGMAAVPAEQMRAVMANARAARAAKRAAAESPTA